jgi:hypothetical protein
VPIGRCLIAVEARGFKRFVRSGVTRSAGQVLQVNVRLELGSTNQQITVAGNVSHVQTGTSAISDVVTGSQITQLDLNGRNFVQLVTAPLGMWFVIFKRQRL